MELYFYMGFVTPPIHFGRVILYVWNSSFQSVFYGLCLVFYATRTLGGTYVPCVSPNVTLIIQYALYIAFLKTLHLPSGEGALSHIHTYIYTYIHAIFQQQDTEWRQGWRRGVK